MFLWTEYSSCALLLMLDHGARCVYRLFDFTKYLRRSPGIAYCVVGKVSSINTVCLAVELIKLDLKHQQSSIAHSAKDGADG